MKTRVQDLPYPKPPLGVLREDRRRLWFRWHVIYRAKWLTWKLRVWCWKLRVSA